MSSERYDKKGDGLIEKEINGDADDTKYTDAWHSGICDTGNNCKCDGRRKKYLYIGVNQ